MSSDIQNDNLLYEYQITTIKEKFGGLRWYDNGYPIGKLSEVDDVLIQEEYKYPPHDGDKDFWSFVEKTGDDKYKWEHRTILDRCKIPDIIRKYEELSYKTCIKCGKPATRISTGWISPFCDNCIEEKYSRPITKADIPIWVIHD